MYEKVIEKRIEKINLLNYKCTDTGAGDLFNDVFKTYVKYVPITKKYFIYDFDKEVWKADTKEQINELAKTLVSAYLPQLLENIKNNNKYEKYKKWIKYLQSNSGIGNMLKNGRSRPTIVIDPDKFDKSIRYLNLKNGILDLKTGEVLDHHRKYLLTKQANVLYDPESSDDTWATFLMSIMDNDKELSKYLLKIIIYAMMGDPKYDVMFIFYGPTTRNGKSTFANSLLNFLGDYGTTTQPDTLAKRKSSGGNASPDLMKLKGVRYINIAEPPNNHNLDVAIIKALTGGDVISARPLYGDYSEFINKGVFCMHTNHLPNVDDPTLFMSGRVIVIPFMVRFPVNKADKDMFSKLTTDTAKSALLNLLLKYMKKYKDNSIKEDLPPKVIDATNKYAEEADRFQCFIEQNIIKKQKEWTATKEILNRYNHWAFKSKHISLSSKAITQELIKRGFSEHRRNIGVGFKDIKLK